MTEPSDFGVIGAPPVPPRNVHEAFALGVPAEALGFVQGPPPRPPTATLPGLPRRTAPYTPRVQAARKT